MHKNVDVNVFLTDQNIMQSEGNTKELNFKGFEI